MGRTPTIDTQTILEAAREVFLEDGIEGTTAEIARRAGVSEGSIFRRFPSKEALFFECMGLSQPAFLASLDERLGRSTVQQELDEFLHEVLEFFEEALPRMLLMMAKGGMAHSADANGSPPVRAIRGVAAYLEREVQAGRLRPHDTEISARILIGSAMHYSVTDFNGVNAVCPMPRHTYVRGVVDQVLRGILPMDGENENS